ncbi:hypothetical protein HQ865_15300 [Mucilaginibacter mali]|uniref:Uncharacterized protein n=1 Tax=Mucilaginibacter mali TaxID=2740462 RepID=A0A7D4UKS1_9SPHI|nr:hypothetical protein [Mucilaginibacter mali]QKJ31062.1 hypothetical protein HQ865_15300 [Mucilaginibacter mali]
MKKALSAGIVLLSTISFISKAQTWSGSTPGNIYYNSGNVGIGTTSPSSNLTVSGDIAYYASGTYPSLLSNSYSNTSWHGPRIGFSRYRGTASSPSSLASGDFAGWFDFFGYDGTTAQRVGQFVMTVDGTVSTGVVPGKFTIATANASGTNTIRLTAYANDYVTMANNGGRVGIGTESPDAKLAVNGTIHSKEVKVDLTGWPDFVFKPAYKLPSLAEVKTYIDKNQHLPDVPSAQEIAKDGLNIGEMNKLLMKKIEELTLYLIEEHDKNQKEIEQLKQQLKAVTNK